MASSSLFFILGTSESQCDGCDSSYRHARRGAQGQRRCVLRLPLCLCSPTKSGKSLSGLQPLLLQTASSSSGSTCQISDDRYTRGGYLQCNNVKSWNRKMGCLNAYISVRDKTEETVTWLPNASSAKQLTRPPPGCTTDSTWISNPKSSTGLLLIKTCDAVLITCPTISNCRLLKCALLHVEISGYQASATTIQVHVLFETETGAGCAAWTECPTYAMATCKLADRSTSNSSNNDTNEILSQSQLQNDGKTTSDGSIKRQRSGCASQEVTIIHRQSPGMAGTDKLSSQSTTAAKVETHRAFVSTYLLMKEIGQGSFSIVHRAVNRRTGIVCAVKCCESSQALRQEEQLLHSLSHPNVVSLEGVYERDKNVHYVVMDYMKDGDLCDLLIQEQHLPESTARGIIRQVAEALAYLHGRCVLHRDIKPENILIHGDMVKIADFGLAKQLVQPTAMLTHGCGTLEYAAPEVLCSRPYGLKSDVFSLGIVLYVLLFGAFPFSIDSTAASQRIHHFPKRVDVRNMRCLDDQPNVHWQTVSPLAQDVLQKMLKTSDLERISAQDLLDHPWFTGADTNMLASVNSNLKASELSRVEDCEAMGFAELLSRGFPVVKHGHERSTTRTTSLSLNFVDLCVSWTARKNPMPTGAATDSNGNATGCRTKQRCTIPLREINEIREGHSARAFSPFESVSPVIPSELCLSIICARRMLDLQVEYQSQRDFLIRGLRRLLAFET